MFQQISKKASKYYEQVFTFQLHKISRPFLIGIILLLAQFFFHVQLSFSSKLNTEMSSDYVSTKIIDSCIFTNKINPIYAVYISLIINLLFIIVALCNFLICEFNFLRNGLLVLESFVGIIASIYQYLIFLPSLLFSISLMEDNIGLSTANIILTIVIELILIWHDQDFRFNSPDSLAWRPLPRDSFIILGLEIISCFLFYNLNSPLPILFPSLFLALFKCYKALDLRGFENRQIRMIYLFLQLTHLMIVFSIFAGLLIEAFQIVSVLALVLIGLSIRITVYVDKIQNDLNSWDLEQDKYIENPEKLDYQLRLAVKNIKLDFSRYSESSQSLFLEQIVVNHIETCEDFPDCFCNLLVVQYFYIFMFFLMMILLKEKEIASFLDSLRNSRNLRFQFMIRFVRIMYGKYIQDSLRRKRGVNSGVCLSYLNFLVDVYQNKVLSFSEIIRIKRNLQLSTRESAQFYEMFERANHSFEKKEIVVAMAYKKRAKFEDHDMVKAKEEQVINSQNSNGSFQESIIVTDFFTGILFDEQLNEIEKKYFNILQEKVNFLLLLFKDHINLMEMKLKGLKILILRDNISQELNEMYKMNQGSQRLQFFAEGFATFFGFGQRKRSLFQDNKSSNFEINKTDSNVFNKDTCVIFITLINDTGKIQRVQNKFESLFGFSRVINESINIILPVCMRKQHDIVLSDFLKNPENSTKNQFQLILAQNNEGFAIPISLKFRPEHILLQDCGLTGFIQKGNTEFNYIQTSMKHFQVQAISQNIFEKHLQVYFSQQEIHKLYLNRFIPILNSLENKQFENENEIGNEIITTLAFFPNLSVLKKGFKKFYPFDKLESKDLISHLNKLSIEYCEVYQVRLKFHSNKFKHFQFNILEIHSFKKVNNYSYMKELLLNYKNQVKFLMNINLDLKQDFEILEQLIQLQILYNKNLNIKGTSKQQLYSLFYLISIGRKQVNLSEESSFTQDEQENISEENPFPLMAQRDLQQQDIKEEPTTFIGGLNQEDFQKTSQQLQLNNQSSSVLLTGVAGRSHAMGNNDLGESHILQGSSIHHLNKFNEISEIEQPKWRFHEIGDLKEDKMDGEYNFLEDKQNEMILLSQPMISPSSQMLSPHNSEQNQFQTGGLISPHYGNEYSSFQTGLIASHHNIEQKSYFPSSIKNEKLVQEQNLNDSSLISFKNMSTQKKQHLQSVKFLMNSKGNESTSDLIGASFNKKKSLEHLTSVTNIFSEYYDMKQKEDMYENSTTKATKIGPLSTYNNSSTLNRGENDLKNEYIFDFESNIFQNNEIKNHKKQGIDLCTILKERIKLVKEQLEQINSQHHLPNQSNLMKESSALNLERFNTMQKKQEKQEKIKHCLKGDDVSSQQISHSSQNEEEQAKEHEKQRSKILGTSSVHTSQSQNIEQKKLIHRLVNSNKRNFSLLMLMIFGVIALSAFIVLVLFQYFQAHSTFQEAQLNFQYLPWAYLQRFNYSKVFSDFMLRLVINSEQLTSLQPSSEHLTKAMLRLHQIVTSFYENTFSFFYSNLQSTTYFKYALETPLAFVITTDVNSLKQPYVNNTEFKINQNISMQYFMIRLAPLFWRAYMLPDLATQIIMQDNFIVFINTVNLIKVVQQNQVVDNLSQIQLQSLIIMLAVMSSVFILGFSAIPLNFHIQRKNEDLLKLFATISSESLNEMLQPILFATNSHKSGKSKYISLPSQKKRKAISSTSTLPKIKGMHFFYIITGISCMIIQPVIGFIFLKDFNSEATLLTDLTQNLYYTKSFCSSMQAVNYAIIANKLNPSFQMYNPQYYYGRFTSLESQKQATLSSFQTIVQGSQKSARYEDNLYQEFFYNIISSNICDTISNYPNLITNRVDDYDKNSAKCSTAGHGILKKGIEISLKNYMDLISDMGKYFSITDSIQFATEFQTQFDLADFDILFDIVTGAIEILKDFLLDRVMSYIQYIEQVFLALLIYQLCMMTAIFYFGYVNFYQSVEIDMFLTKKTLNVLSIDSVIENPYIFSYLMKTE